MQSSNESGETSGQSAHEAIVTAKDETAPRFEFKWARPQFSPDDGIADMEKLSHLGELVLAFGYMDDEGIYAIGSGVMVAPGLLLTATHVVEETKGTAGMAFSFLDGGKMRIWAPEQVHFLTGRIDDPLDADRRRTSDVCLASCSLISSQVEDVPLRMAHIEIALPAVGERLWAVGCRETLRHSEPGVTMMCSSGLVTDRYPDGRGDHLPNPCVAVAMNTLGGMSGGPVFNSDGHLVGIVSSSHEAEDGRGPTYVSMAWVAFRGEVDVTWPKNFWPENEAGLLSAYRLGHAKVSGEFEIDPDGMVKIITPLTASEIAQIGRNNRKPSDTP